MFAHQQLLGLVVASLSADPVLSSGPVLRQRRRAMAEGEQQLVVVGLGRSLAQTIVMRGAPLDWQTILAVEYVARCGASLNPDEAVAPLITAGHAALVGSSALSAAGFQVDPNPTIDWDQQEADERIGACTAQYVVRHRTSDAHLNA